MNLNPFTFFGLLKSRNELVPEAGVRPNGGAANGGTRTSGRATLLQAPDQAVVDAVCAPKEDAGAIMLREEREAAQAKLASTTINLHGSLDELIAQQVCDTQAREKEEEGHTPTVQGS